MDALLKKEQTQNINCMQQEMFRFYSQVIHIYVSHSDLLKSASLLHIKLLRHRIDKNDKLLL